MNSLGARRIAGRIFRRILPSGMRLHWIALRNWMRGEPEIRIVKELCDTRRTSVDVGACLGTYAYFMRPHSRSVVAIDPHPVAAAWLRKAFGNRIQVLQVAASDVSARLVLRVPLDPAMTGMATVESGNPVLHSTVSSVTVSAEPLDVLSIGAVGLIKIDVEGHETAVLRGAATLIERDHPAFIIEAEERHRPGAVQEVIGWLANRGYDGWYLRRGYAHSTSTFRAERDQPIAARGRAIPGADYVNNFIFVHRDDPRRESLVRRMRGGPDR